MSARFLFVFPPTGAYCREDRCQSYFKFDLVPSMRPPLEECESAGAIRDAGGSAAVIDAPALGLDEAQTLQKIRNAQFDYLIITTTFGSFDADMAFIARVKALMPTASIGLRGAPCYTHTREIMNENKDIDFLVRGDYELAFASIVRDGLQRAAGITQRSPLGLRENPAPTANDLDALPLPDRSVVDASRYTVRGFGKPQATIHVQRGCPFPCTYCLVATVTGKKARHRSPESIASEMRTLWNDGYRHFYLRAETFTVDKRWAREVSRAIALDVPGAKWVTATRVDTIDDDTTRAMARAGCYGMSFGVETGSKRIGELVKKVPDFDEANAAFRACDKHGVLSLMYVMLGFLWETPDTVAETERFVHDVCPDLLTLYFAHPYPGTAYFDDVHGAGVKFSGAKAQAEAAFEPEGISLSEIKKRALIMTAKHYARPRVIASVGKKLGANAAAQLLR